MKPLTREWVEKAEGDYATARRELRALKRDVPEAGLRVGDLGAVVEVHDADRFEVEFVAASGRTQALVTLRSDDIRHVNDLDLIAVRSLQRAVG